MQAEIFCSKSNAHFDKKYSHGFMSMFLNIRRIARNEGFLALYNGFSASMFGVLHPLLFFPMYEKLKIYFMKNFETREKLSIKYILLATIISKVGSSAVSYPHEVLRSRLMYQKKELDSSILKTGTTKSESIV